METGVHPRLFIIPWCETYNIAPNIARRLWVEGFQDGDTVEAITDEDLRDLNFHDSDINSLLRAVSSYKNNKENVDKAIRLWTSKVDADNMGCKKDRRKELLKNSKPKGPPDPIVESVLANMKKESPQQRKDLVRRLRNKRKHNDNLSLAERISLQRNELLRNGYGGTISAPPLDTTGRPVSMTSVQTTPPVFTDQEGYGAAMADEFGTYPHTARYAGSLPDSGISEEDLDALLRDAERLKHAEPIPEDDHFTPEEEALMKAITESGPEGEEQILEESAPIDHSEAGERAYTPNERALMESIREEAGEESETPSREEGARDSGFGGRLDEDNTT